MSVFTSVTHEDLIGFLTEYDVGTLVEHHGIADGIENSNFFVTTTQGEFVLTLFERVDPEDLPFFMQLTSRLANSGVACMHPVADTSGGFTRKLNGRDAALVVRLAGNWLSEHRPRHCEAVGAELARMHLAGLDFPIRRLNGFSNDWMRNVIEQVRPLASDDDNALLELQMQEIEEAHLGDLPHGIIHADIFQDNVLFENDELSGFIDFYYACYDVLIYDLAITINDWCRTETGHINADFLEPLMRGYESVRPLSAEEQSAMPTMLRRAAFRFWLSRLRDKLFPREGEMVLIKNPDIFKNLLLQHRARPAAEQITTKA